MEEKANQPNLIAKKYSPFNLEQFTNWLRDMKDNNQPKFIEVYVDDMKVVAKTDNIDEFERHEQYVDDETEKIRVLVYNTEKSNRYKQHIFKLKEPQSSAQPLSGTEVTQQIEDGISRGLKAMEEKLLCDQVKKELAESKEELKDAKEYSDKLAAYIESLKEKIGNADGRKEIMGMIRDYGPALLGVKVPPSSNAPLSGNPVEDKNPEEQAEFKMKNSEENSFSEDEKNLLEFGKSLRANFTKEEFEMVMTILDELVKDKANVKSVQSFLNINTNPQKTQNEKGKV
jgi:hypothetical protein